MIPSVKIAVDCRPLIDGGVNGVTVYTHEMIRALSALKNVELLLFYQNGKKVSHLHERYPEIEFIHFSSLKFHLMMCFSHPAIPDRYFSDKPDLIWMPDRRPFWKTDMPLVMTLHDHVPKKFPNSLSWKARFWHVCFPTEILLSRADGVLLPSRSIEDGIETNIIKCTTYAGARPILEKEIKNLPKNFHLFIAPNDPRKRIDWFLSLAKDFPNENFIWIGGRKKDSNFASMKISLPSNVQRFYSISESEKWFLLKRAKSLLALSEYEGFDLPVLEALKVDCPVIMSDIAVHRELYEGINFIKTYEDLLKEFLKKIYPIAKMKRHYSWESAAEKALFCFKRVIQHKNRQSCSYRDSDNCSQYT